MCWLTHLCSGSRLDAMDCLEVAAVYGLSLFALDFAGAGHSEGDYISLGFHEQNDVEAVVEYLLHTQKISSICLWGRSMGAATSVLFAARNRYPELVCLVLDSPFASLKEIATEVILLFSFFFGVCVLSEVWSSHALTGRRFC